jgi:sacsin
MANPKEHIQQIRTTKFSIGGKPNPLTEDLHHAVKNLSAELYAKDVHFLMELIQVHLPFSSFSV